MKKFLAIFLALIFALSMVACAQQTPAEEAPAEEAPAEEAPAEETPAEEAEEAPAEEAPADGTYEIALVTDIGNIDDKSFNQGSWEGVVEYAEANGKTYNYYRPSEDSDEARIESIETAIDKGAKVVVMPGYLFGPAVQTVQAEYPDVMFLGIDMGLGDVPEPTANVSLITYQEEQAGYLAGYAAVQDGYRKLGFLGGIDVPAVIRYGYGYVQGVDAAAKELGITVDMKYAYGNQFYGDADITAVMDTWYADGTEVVFACGGGIYNSVVAAAEEGNGKVVGVVRNPKQVPGLMELGVYTDVIVADCTKPVEVMEAALAANDGKEYDLSICCVNIESCEMSAILPVHDDGLVYFFSMATSFTKAALGAEGIGKDVTMIIGNGYTKNHAQITLDVLRENPKLRKLFDEKYC